MGSPASLSSLLFPLLVCTGCLVARRVCVRFPPPVGWAGAEDEGLGACLRRLDDEGG